MHSFKRARARPMRGNSHLDKLLLDGKSSGTKGARVLGRGEGGGAEVKSHWIVSGGIEWESIRRMQFS